MTRVIAALGLLAVLAACGADGEPVPPPPKADPEVEVSGLVGGGATVARSSGAGYA